MEEVAEVSDELMERYLEGDEISHEEIVDALGRGTNHGSIFPVVCGVATRNLGTNRLLESIVDDLPSPVEHGALRDGRGHARALDADARAVRLRLQDARRPVRRADQPAARLPGHADPRLAAAQHAHALQGADRAADDVRRQGHGQRGGVRARATSAASRSSRTRAPGDWLAARDEPITMPTEQLPAPVMAFAIEPKTKGDEDKVFSSLRRLQEEDPTIDLHRDPQTGQQIVAGLSQIHVEVIVERLKTRFGAEVTLKPPRVPYQETIRAVGEGARPPQEAVGRARPVRRLPHRDRAARVGRRLRVRRPDQGRRDPRLVHPGGREGRARGDGGRRCSPATRSRTCA